MKMEIKIGDTVMTPVTDSDGEVSHVFGILVSINSRYAKVDLGDRIISVGKTKVELVGKPSKAKKAAKTEDDLIESQCLGCGAKANEDDVISIDDIKAAGGDWKSIKRVNWCQCCGQEFGPKVTDTGRIAEGYKYSPCIAASGRTSCDNDDSVAHILRGRELNEVYTIVAEQMGVPEKELKARYGHLNSGQQRMNLGNRLRGFVRKQNAK